MKRAKGVLSQRSVVGACALLVAGSAWVAGERRLVPASASMETIRTAVESAAEALPASEILPVGGTVAASVARVLTGDVARDSAEARQRVISADERERLAAEMARWVTRHPRQLVDVIADLAEAQPLPLSETFLLSIAWSETRGKILAVSPAGAAGLAQATPAAFLSEGFAGKVYVTNDYLAATRAFIMKKPLGDAKAISASLLKKNTPATRKRAAELTERAIELRAEGMDELEALEPVGNAVFQRRINENYDYNLTTLRQLEELIARGAPKADTKRFNERISRDYTYLYNQQKNGWARYAKDLTARRDELLRKQFDEAPATVILNRPYEAGEYLGEALDARFSPTQMARFLAAHLETKQRQARELGVEDDALNAWTAALYNGGAVNVKRMQAGLIRTLTETQKYMKAVPAKSARLEEVRG